MLTPLPHSNLVTRRDQQPSSQPLVGDRLQGWINVQKSLETVPAAIQRQHPAGPGAEHLAGLGLLFPCPCFADWPPRSSPGVLGAQDREYEEGRAGLKATIPTELGLAPLDGEPTNQLSTNRCRDGHGGQMPQRLSRGSLLRRLLVCRQASKGAA